MKNRWIDRSSKFLSPLSSVAELDTCWLYLTPHMVNHPFPKSCTNSPPTGRTSVLNHDFYGLIWVIREATSLKKDGLHNSWHRAVGDEAPGDAEIQHKWSWRKTGFKDEFDENYDIWSLSPIFLCLKSNPSFLQAILLRAWTRCLVQPNRKEKWPLKKEIVK